MARLYQCPRCGFQVTPQERARDRFCPKCGTYLRPAEGGGGEGWRRVFPYEPYPQQVEFMGDVESTVVSGGTLVAEACNGFGKTVAALSCLLPTGRPIVYATRTHEQVAQVLREVEAINRARSAGHRAVNLASRRLLCVNDECRLLPLRDAQEVCRRLRSRGECPYESDLDRVPRGLPPVLGVRELVSQARRRGVCPYYLSRKLASKVEVVVAPYPYVFNPSIRRLTGLDLEGKFLVLDEGHNVDQVGQEVLSDSLTERTLSAATQEVQQLQRPTQPLEGLRGYLEEACRGSPRLIAPGELAQELEEALGASIPRVLDEYAPLVERVREAKQSKGQAPICYLNGVLIFLELVEESPRESYVGLFHTTPSGAPLLEYRCLDPSLAVAPLVEEAHGVLVMSGTLSPLETFTRVVGLEGAVVKSYPPIQRSDRIKMTIDTRVTTAYRERTKAMIRRLGKSVEEAAQQVDHGVLVFFTQKGFMKNCLAEWTKAGIVELRRGAPHLAGKRVFLEGRDAQHNQRVVEQYKRAAVTPGGAVLFSVFRGRNSEGSNFPGDQARGVVLVGVPYANYGDPLVKAQIAYFNRVRRGLGNQWYTMDAFRAANQSLGRGIRGRDDWCHYWLLDRRYHQHLDLISEWAKGQGPQVV